MPPVVLGLDVGGANLKAASTTGAACLQPFELWKNPAGLAEALTHLLATFPGHDLLAVTMTGELCDCFATKRGGVLAILDAVEAAAGRSPVRVWRTDGRLVEPAVAREDPLQAAASNWLALATYAGRFAPEGPALVMDLGSTTTDLIPLQDGQPVPRGRSDPERLRGQELVYTGVRRTPLCAVLGGDAAAEWFATTLDAYLVLGDLPEDAADYGTADRRPATVPFAHARLARMLCADRETCPVEDTLRMALAVKARQVQLVRGALNRVAASLPAPPATVILAGSGEFLAAEVLDTPPAVKARRVSLANDLGPELSACACAYALAILAAEYLGREAVAHTGPVVVKVGGSLFDLPDLRDRLDRWLEGLGTHTVVLVPGGGPTADVVRAFDQRFALGDERAHWLALQALTLNASFLANLLPNAVIVPDGAACPPHWAAGKTTILDPYAFAHADEGQPGALPHSWEVTSDSLAARVAAVVGARRLILLKSVGFPEGVDWAEAGRRGLVDPFFARAVGEWLRVQVVDFRHGS